MGGVWFQLCTRGNAGSQREESAMQEKCVCACMHACVCMCVRCVCVILMELLLLVFSSRQCGERLIQRMDLEFDTSASEALEART